MEYPFKVAKGLPKPATGILAEVAHLRDMVFAMIAIDVAMGRDLPAPPVQAAGPQFKRSVPAPASPLRSKLPKSLDAKDKAASAAAAAIDDPKLRELEEAYLGKKFTEPAKKTGNGKAKRTRALCRAGHFLERGARCVARGVRPTRCERQYSAK